MTARVKLRADGTLWGCGHPVESLVEDEAGVLLCLECNPDYAERRQQAVTRSGGTGLVNGKQEG